jgi:hypothetical protein
VTVGVARTLHKNGRVFLVDAFHGNAELAGSVNHLLVVGFYLINIGYVTLALRTSGNLDTLRAAIELVSDKIIVVNLIKFSSLPLMRPVRKLVTDVLEIVYGEQGSHLSNPAGKNDAKRLAARLSSASSLSRFTSA